MMIRNLAQRGAEFQPAAQMACEHKRSFSSGLWRMQDDYTPHLGAFNAASVLVIFASVNLWPS